jgi:hypothetical protein
MGMTSGLVHANQPSPKGTVAELAAASSDGLKAQLGSNQAESF